MSNVDRSASATTRLQRQKALVYYFLNNPPSREGGSSILSEGVHTERRAAQIQLNCGPITNFTCSDYVPLDSSSTYHPIYDGRFDLSWDTLPGSTYVLTSDYFTDLIIYTGTNNNGVSTANIYILDDSTTDGLLRTFTLTSNSVCGTLRATATGLPCFLAGSLVTMADGSELAIELVSVGDMVLGAFGEINTVLALHRPLLGNNPMCNINNEHNTTNHHPHISVDKKFYSGNPELVSKSTYGRITTVIDGSGNEVEMMLHGLKKERIQQLQVGIELKTVSGGRSVRSLETYSMPEDTQLYNLVISGSHTYHVDGYAVTGWPREDDFNYDTWTQ